jgi:hypothetical protein
MKILPIADCRLLIQASLAGRCLMKAAFLNGGTGVAPVKSGVAPDFVSGRSQLVNRKQIPAMSPAGFGRDAQNNRPEACAT